MFRCLMCWNIKRTLFVRALALFVLFMMKVSKSTAGFEGQFLSPAVIEKTTTTQQSKLCTTVQPCVIPAPSVGWLMNTLVACSEMKDLIHQTPVPRSLLTTCAINFTNEQCHVGLEQKTTKHFISRSSRSCGFPPAAVGGASHILLALRGRHPLCGTGVSSVMDTTSRPPIVRPLMADCTARQTQQVYVTALWQANLS